MVDKTILISDWLISEVAGWGAVDILARRFSDILRYVIVPISNTDQCNDIYKMQRVNLGRSIFKFK